MTGPRRFPRLEAESADAALQALQTYFSEVLFCGHPSSEEVEGDRFPANLAALHGSPARREWLVIGEE